MKELKVEASSADWISPQVKAEADFKKYYNNTFLYVSLRTDTADFDSTQIRQFYQSKIKPLLPLEYKAQLRKVYDAHFQMSVAELE